MTNHVNPIVLYGIANCDTVKKSRAWFASAGKAYVFHDFKKQGVPQEELRVWAEKLGWQALLNTQGTTWRKLPAARQAAVVDAESAMQLMQEYPSVIKRPVLTCADTVILGFAPNLWNF